MPFKGTSSTAHGLYEYIFCVFGLVMSVMSRCDWNPDVARPTGWIPDSLSNALMTTRNVLVGDADIAYSTMPSDKKRGLIMSLLGTLSSAECRCVMDILPGGGSDPLVPIMRALYKIYSDIGMLPGFADEKDASERLLDPASGVAALRASELAFRNPPRDSPLLTTHSKSSARWFANLLRDYGVVISYLKDPKEPATNQDYVGFAGDQDEAANSSVRVVGPRILVLTQRLAHMAHLRLFMATRLFGGRRIHDYEAMRRRLANNVIRTPEDAAEIQAWPPESYISDWMRELGRTREEKAVPPTVHEFYYNGL